MADYEYTTNQKLAVIDGKDYVGKPISADQYDAIQQIKGNAPLANRTWIALTFGISVDEAGALPATAFYKLLKLALDANGLMTKAEAAGEAPATESATTSESASPIS